LRGLDWKDGEAEETGGAMVFLIVIEFLAKWLDEGRFPREELKCASASPLPALSSFSRSQYSSSSTRLLISSGSTSQISDA
jgi:hypothetical protein